MPFAINPAYLPETSVPKLQYRCKVAGYWRDFQLTDDYLQVKVSRKGVASSCHQFPRDMLGSGYGLDRRRDRATTNAIQLICLAFFGTWLICSVVFEWITSKTGLIWAGILISIFGMCIASRLSPWRREYIIYLTNAGTLIPIVEKRGAKGKAEFEFFVRALRAWQGLPEEFETTDTEVQPGK